MKNWLGRFLSSSLGRKYVMAVSGLSLVLFLVAHLAGNLSLFFSDSAFNAYAHALESNPLLPLAEAGLAGVFLVHIALAFVLIAKNRAARKDKYQSELGSGGRSLASATMTITGPIVLVFLLIHLYDFRISKMFADEGYDLALAVRARLSSPLGATIYIFGLLALGVHLWHAFQSSFQTLGLGHPRARQVIVWIGRLLAVGLFVGFVSIPFWLFMLRG
ncbi:MAG: succinate dehydrogenase cytochrome b subunit [Planctomycetota bacterium]